MGTQALQSILASGYYLKHKLCRKTEFLSDSLCKLTGFTEDGQADLQHCNIELSLFSLSVCTGAAPSVLLVQLLTELT